MCLGKEAEDGHEEAHPADSKILCASVSGSGSSLGIFPYEFAVVAEAPEASNNLITSACSPLAAW